MRHYGWTSKNGHDVCRCGIERTRENVGLASFRYRYRSAKGEDLGYRRPRSCAAMKRAAAKKRAA